MEFRIYEKAEEKDIEPEFKIVCSKCDAVVEWICLNVNLSREEYAYHLKSLDNDLLNEVINDTLNEITGDFFRKALKRHKCS